MIKNTSGQKIGAQLISATDGSAFTGSVTVYVTGDAGTQAAGSVGSGACAHEGNGYHTYAPAQAETNYDLIAFTFTGTGAIPVTVQVFTNAGDAFTRLGAPAGASVSADIAAVKSDTAATLADTGTDGVVVAAGSKNGYGLAADQSAVTIGTVNAVATGGITDASIAAGAIQVKKNTALANFMWLMIDSSDHVTPKNGLTVACQRSIDGGAFANCNTATATEIANGIYKVNLAASDLNGDVIAFKFTATGADATYVTVVTQ